MTWFFDHLADDDSFLEAGKPIDHPILPQLLPAILGAIRKPPVRLANILLITVPGTKFIHGGFSVGGFPGTLIYFEDIDWGLVALLRPDGQTTDFMRFRCHTVGQG